MAHTFLFQGRQKLIFRAKDSTVVDETMSPQTLSFFTKYKTLSITLLKEIEK